MTTNTKSAAAQVSADRAVQARVTACLRAIAKNSGAGSHVLGLAPCLAPGKAALPESRRAELPARRRYHRCGHADSIALKLSLPRSEVQRKLIPGQFRQARGVFESWSRRGSEALGSGALAGLRKISPRLDDLFHRGKYRRDHRLADTPFVRCGWPCWCANC